MAQPTANYLEQIPEELRQLMLRQLSEDDLARLARVSRTIRSSVFINLQTQLADVLQRYDYAEQQIGDMIALVQQIHSANPEFLEWDPSTPPSAEVQQVLDLLGDVWNQINYSIQELNVIGEHAQALTAFINSI
ncbi:MAG TPA: hypothetical protein VGX25_14950 [Actinophytocola sp.]|uniref:F-box protein n=1 Tax=Actinophytocola sp. TaxID=1872138 RepID=UPI002DDC90F9|nr:hypothetical protein [Actinophytocola sp.]HEV2780685.1 hypothetical protein [Actinophytocola sp.]